MTTYTIDPVNNKLVADKESKDVKMMKNIKKEKIFEKILDKKKEVKPLSAEEAIALQNRNYDDWGLLKATAQTPQEKAELRAIERKYEKKPERIEVEPININLNFPTKPSIIDKTVEQHLADTEREYYKNNNENTEALNSGGIASLFKPKR
jgi:predicted nucleotidyltransferase